MLSRISSNAENCGQSSGDAGGTPAMVIVCPGATSVGIASPRFETMPSQTTRENQCPAISERLEIFNDGNLVRRRERRSVFMAAIAVARYRCVVLKEHATFLLRDVRDESDPRPVKNVVAAIEHLRPFVRRIHQVEQRRNGPVVEIRSACPDAVEWMVG